MMKADNDINDLKRREYRDELRRLFDFIGDIPLRRKDARYKENITWIYDYYQVKKSEMNPSVAKRLQFLLTWLKEDCRVFSDRWM